MNYIFNNKEWREKLLNRFTKYTKIWSESNGEAADNGKFPSTEQQWDFARILTEEMRSLGLENVQLTDKCYVYGNIPASTGMENCEPVLLLAHMDTVDEVSGKDVKPQIKEQDGDWIISSDGSTLLGGDDKAGVSAIMTMAEFLMEDQKSKKQINHGMIEIIFSPDEETGHGMDFVPMELIKSKKAYTVDGGSEGEMETECFNAWSGTIHFLGKATHTGDAKAGGMVNANLMAAGFISQLPENMRPETTEKYEPFIAVMSCEGSIEHAQVDLLLRAFSIEEINKEKRIIEKAALLAAEAAGGKSEVFFNQQYLNMKEKIDLNPAVIEKLEKAYKAANVEIIRKPIRGGTDGSRLTEMGIPTPNIFTGGHNFHSRNEWVSLNQLCKSADVLINLVSE